MAQVGYPSGTVCVRVRNVRNASSTSSNGLTIGFTLGKHTLTSALLTFGWEAISHSDIRSQGAVAFRFDLDAVLISF